MPAGGGGATAKFEQENVAAARGAALVRCHTARRKSGAQKTNNFSPPKCCCLKFIMHTHAGRAHFSSTSSFFSTKIRQVRGARAFRAPRRNRSSCLRRGRTSAAKTTGWQGRGEKSVAPTTINRDNSSLRIRYRIRPRLSPSNTTCSNSSDTTTTNTKIIVFH